MGDINPRDNEGMTPLMCAAQYNNEGKKSQTCRLHCIEGRTALQDSRQHYPASSAILLSSINSGNDVNITVGTPKQTL